MKTKEELLIQIQHEFDKENRELFLITSIATIALMGIECFILIVSIKRNEFDTWMFMGVITIIVGFVIWLLNRLLCNELNMRKKAEELTKEIEERKKINDKTSLIFPILKAGNEFYLSEKMIDALLEFTVHYQYCKLKTLKELKEKLEEDEEKFEKSKIKLEFYKSVPERNFWQYLKSMMWLKKL